MSTRIDWHEELDSSFGSGPDRPPADYLAPGHAALRRRRTALGAAALAGVVVIGGIGWTLAPGQDGPRSSDLARDIATDPAASATTAPTRSAAGRFQLSEPIDSRPADVRAADEGDEPYFDGGNAPVAVVRDGNLAIADGWSVEEVRVLTDTPKARAWGVSAVPDAGGDASWMIIEWDRSSSATTSDPAGKRFSVFSDWVDTTWAELGVDHTPPEIASTIEGRLVPADGVTVLEQLDRPDGTEAYGPLDELVAAKLRLSDGSVVFALVTPDSATTVDPAVLAAPTMPAFLEHLRGQASSGEGLR